MTTYFRAASEDETTPYRAGRMGYLRQDDDVTTGVWNVAPDETPGPIPMTLVTDRTVYIVAGSVRYDVADGPTYDLHIGDTASFTPGTRLTVTVTSPLRQFFVDRHVHQPSADA